MIRTSPGAGFDATGRPNPERFSEYFDFEKFPAKADRFVTRSELSRILRRLEETRRDQVWYRRLWRWVKGL